MANRRFDAVIFDLDGTLCDSEPFIAAAAGEALRRRYGITVPPEDFVPFVGGGDDWYISGAAAAHGVTSDLAIDKPLTYEIYLDLIPGAMQPIRGALGFITAVRAAGLKLALATGSARPKLRANLAAIGLDEADFDVTISADDVHRKKPDPESYLVTAGKLGVDPARCLVMEDARNGVLSGVAAGCDVVAITSSQSADVLREAGARAVVADFTAIPADVLADLGVSPAPPTTLVFDLGGVLSDWSPYHLYRQLLPDDAAIAAFIDEVGLGPWNHELDAGRSWAEAVAELSAKHPARRELIEAFHERWLETLGDPIAGTVEVLRDARDAGLRLLALTNWSGETFPIARQQERMAFLDWFEGIVVSGDEGIAKPDPRIFERLMERYALDPATALYIDDMPHNVTAAQALGFRAVRFTSPEALRADLVRLGVLAEREPAPADA
jgi:2-haloacid dehalogenase